MDEVLRRPWFRSARAARIAVLLLIVLLCVGGYLLTSRTIRSDRDAAASRRADVETLQTQEVLGRARAYVQGLGDVLASEPRAGQSRFARLAGATAASVGLNAVLWVQEVPGSRRGRYERRIGAPITRLTRDGRFERAPSAASYLPATFTSRGRQELRSGVDVSSFPGLAPAIRNRATVFAVGASSPGSLGTEPGFYLLETARFGRSGASRGFLVAFVPQGWFTTTLGGDPRGVAISQDGKRIEGNLDEVAAAASFDALGRTWRIDVAREPPSELQSTLPWLALTWPIAAALIAFGVGRAILLRRRAERSVDRIFDLSPDLLASAGFDGYFKRVNPAFERTLGYPVEEFLARPYLEFVHPDDRERTAGMAGVIGEGQTTLSFENRYLCKDGSYRWIQWTSRPAPVEGVMYGIGRDVTEHRRAQDEQAALRRVATLIARAAPSEELFNAVSKEVGTLFGADLAGMFRYEDDDTMTILPSWSAVGGHLDAPGRVSLEGATMPNVIRDTGRPAREDAWDELEGEVAELNRDQLGVRSAVGSPIVVEGRVWGALWVSSTQSEHLPADTESRLENFTELVGTAIANAQARADVQRLADEQAALRRVATLVAQGSSPTALFDAVAAEMEALLDSNRVMLNRFEPDGEVTVVAHRGPEAWRLPPGSRLSHEGGPVSSLIRRTERSARLDEFEPADAATAELARVFPARASVGAPIVVDGRLWGIIAAIWTGENSPPADTEERMAKFAQLLDTAIANADSRDQLTASRARLLSAGDEARRRVVRDLHDGAQQRLVHTIVTLKLAQRAMREDDGTAESLIGEALDQAKQGTEELRELAHGMLPSALSNGGLRAGVDALVRRLDLPVRVDVPARRFPAELEASAYFIVAEALTNVVKHSHARRAEVSVSVDDEALRVEVRDDGVGGADPDGHGLVGLGDRATALGGRLTIESPADGGTLVTAALPLTA